MSAMSAQEKQSRQGELLMFLFLNFILWPVFTIFLVGAYGLAIWIYQWFFGPPGPGI